MAEHPGSWTVPSDLRFYPWGMDVLRKDGFVLTPLLSVPLQAFCSPPAAYNLLVLAYLTLTGWSACLLARQVSRSWTVGWTLGGLATLYPLYLRDMLHGSGDQLCLQWLFLWLLFASRYLGVMAEGHEPGRRRDLLAALVFGLLACVSNWYSFLALIIASTAVLAFAALQRETRGRALRLAALLLAVAAPYVLVSRAVLAPPSAERLAFDPAVLRPATLRAVDAHAFGPALDPLPRATVLSARLVQDSVPLAWDWSQPILPVLLTAVALSALLLGRGPHLAWLVALAVAGMLMLGPYAVHARLEPSTVPLPYAALLALSDAFLQLRPYRFQYAALAPLVVLCAAVGGVMISRPRTPLTPTAAAVLVVALAFADARLTTLRGPYLGPTRPPEGYARVHRGPVIAWPVYPNTLEDSRYQWFQSSYRQPVLNYIFLRPDAVERLAEHARGNAMLRFLLDGTSEVAPADVERLRAMGFRQLLLRTRVECPEERTLIEAHQLFGMAFLDRVKALLGPPEVADGLLIFPMASRPTRVPASVTPVDALDTGPALGLLDLRGNGWETSFEAAPGRYQRFACWLRGDGLPDTTPFQLELWQGALLRCRLPVSLSSAAWSRLEAPLAPAAPRQARWTIRLTRPSGGPPRRFRLLRPELAAPR